MTLPKEKRPLGWGAFALVTILSFFVAFLAVASMNITVKSDKSEQPIKVIYVTGNTVNMRDGPSMKAAILRQLHKGDELIEKERKGNWVMVGRQGKFKAGWVHSSLLTRVEPEAPPETTPSAMTVDVFEGLPTAKQTEELGRLVSDVGEGCVPTSSSRKGKDANDITYYVVTCRNDKSWLVFLMADRAGTRRVLSCAWAELLGIACFEPWDRSVEVES
jgi:hypothetical protein